MKTINYFRSVLGAALLAVALFPGKNSAGPVPPPDFDIHCSSIGPAGTPFVRGINCRVVQVDGYPRDYIVYVPRSPAFNLKKPAPVVFHFHGTGGSAQHTIFESGWWEKAEEVGFIAVFGSALPYRERLTGEINPKWSSYSIWFEADLSFKPPGYPPTAPWPADDVKFTDIMLADVRSLLMVDARRLHISGFSSGGAMTLRLAIDRSQVFASAACAAGQLLRSFDPPRKMPLYYAVGTRDGHLLDSINFAADGPVPPINEVPLAYAEAFAFSGLQSRIDYFTQTFGLPALPDHVWEFDNELRLRYRTPQSGNFDRNELTFSLQGGVTHQFADGGNNPEGFDDRDCFWKFFHDHPLPK